MPKKKHLTFLIFDDYRYKEVKSFRLSTDKILVFFLCTILFLMGSIGSYSLMIRYFFEKHNMHSYKKENKELKRKMDEYSAMIADIEKKILNIEGYQNKINKVVKDTGKNTNLAIGGLEIEATREISTIADKKEKELFKKLDEILNRLGEELDEHSQNYINYLNTLEELSVVWQSTPSITPVAGSISSGFGYRISPFSRYSVIHGGLDISAPYGSPIKASARGIVVFTGYKALYGNMVVIDHGYGFITRYGHCSKILVKEGDIVKKGSIIAKVGTTGRTTGPHVHFEVLVNGIPANPSRFVQSINKS
jgi:murein DD-endopeptidase MepM/ murein hydrolase activator NlpD